MKSKHRIVLTAALFMFTLMFLFEFTKEQVFKGTLSPWESHWITIFFTTSMAFILTIFAVKRVLELEERENNVSVKEEKLKTIGNVMRVVFHHVNNLSNNLSLIELEMKTINSVNESTLQSLNHSISGTTQEMKRLESIKDPFDEDAFTIKYD